MRALLLLVSSAVLVPVVLLSVVGCSDDDDGPTIDVERPECENLNPNHCLMPWPSSRYLIDDASTTSGRRIELPLEAVPVNQFDEAAASLNGWNRFDGFSAMTSLITLFAGEVDTSNLPDENSIGASLDPAMSPTIIIDAESGELIAHFSETDQWDVSEEGRRSFYIRPATRLEEGRRYIAAIRNLSYTDGNAVQPSDYFKALRDGTTTSVTELEDRRALFEDIFAKLAAAGVPRESLIEAWDFHTASGESTWGQMLAMRDDALTRVGDDGLGCTIESVEDDVNAETWRRVRGTYTVPLYMTTPFEGTTANRDADGNIVFNTMAEAPFEVDIPVSLRDRIQAGGEPGRIIMYGHGLLGTAGQVGSGGTRTALARLEAVGVGTDYWGMADRDEFWFVENVVTNFGNFWQMGERIMQGTINSVVLARSFLGSCAAMPEFQIDVGGTPMPSYDTSTMYYYGISQGGIFGATVAGLSTDIERYSLQVGAVNYPVLINRSFDFNVFDAIFRLWYPDKVDRDWLIVASASSWDATDPATYAPHLIQDPLPGTPPKRIHYHVARHDAQVSNVASDMAARSIGLPYFRSSVYEPWGLQPTDGPVDSGYVIYALDNVDPIPTGAVSPLADNDAHNDLRYLDPFLMQLDTFLRPDGQMEDFCPNDSCLIENTRAD